MKTIKTTIPISPLFNHRLIKLEPSTQEIELKLTDGDHVATSSPIQIGTSGPEPLFAQVELPYTISDSGKFIKLCDDDSRIDNTINLRLGKGQKMKSEAILKHMKPTEKITKKTIKTLLENEDSPLENNLRKTLKNAQDNIIKNAREHGLGVLLRKSPPAITSKNINNLIGICGLDKDKLNAMSENERISYLEMELKSTYGGLGIITTGTQFANVIGSTHDPKIDGKYWISAWKDFTKHKANQCASKNWRSNGKNYCKGILIGGHVILGTVPSEVTPETDKTVFIVPICTSHNARGDFYMKAQADTPILWLNDYFRTEH